MSCWTAGSPFAAKIYKEGAHYEMIFTRETRKNSHDNGQDCHGSKVVKRNPKLLP
jgi:hypothetical protein